VIRTKEVTNVGDDTPLRKTSMGELIERSSFGSGEARRQRGRTPKAVKQKLLASVLRPAAGPTAAAPYFYLSYARGSDAAGQAPDADVQRFFRMLCTHLGQLAPDVVSDEHPSPDEMLPGYLVGDPSAGRLGMLEALSSCRIFVPVLTADYFDKEGSREEWENFQRRDEMRRARHPFGISAIVPVLWNGIADLGLPAWATGDVQLTEATLGREYVQLGIDGLRAKNGPAYRKTGFRIAQEINGVAECVTVVTGGGI
jgi:hypothetical protein